MMCTTHVGWLGFTVKSHVEYALVYNTQSDFSLLSMGKIQVHVCNMHRLLLKSFQ